ncbi:MAG: glucose-6-phosphate dehydrogenase [Candidatus Hydrogenedentes bacterium]|nr:glucose-6-phosphate dehydrogenase [Candidatus Hydrogenedentota bacterium]
MEHTMSTPSALSIVVIGASGDLAVKKIFPALFALYCRKLLPESFTCHGFARSPMSDEQFRNLLKEHLTCRYTPGETACRQYMDVFLNRCFYTIGRYDSVDDYQNLKAAMEKHEPASMQVTRLFYFSIPPFLFGEVAKSLHAAKLSEDHPGKSACRIVVEKPFGRDRSSSDALTRELSRVFTEPQTYRIDHYLGKEVVQNLMVLRFANLIFEPLWNRNNIAHVHIYWSEDIGTEGRAGYFDKYGILRDVMQNHLLQMLALVAMEEPLNLNPESVRNEKVKVLRAISPVTLDDIVVGQYTAAEYQGKQHNGYLGEDGVPADSITPTYAAAVLKVHNRRWDGIPFLISAGKGLHDRKTEIHIAFRHVPANIFAASTSIPAANELLIRVQPDAGISLNIMTKVPGLRVALRETELNLSYAAAFTGEIPDAYESLLLDVIQGDKSLFIRADELEAAWDIFTPVLHDLESCTIPPQPYPFGSHGPKSALALAALHEITPL